MRRIVVTLLTIVGTVAFAQSSGTVIPQEEVPSIDGKVATSEYGLNLPYDSISVHLALVDDTLYVAAKATTIGWVAVGFGSKIMDGARILFSFVDGDGQVFFSEQVGRDHTHNDASDSVVITHAVSEHDGTTTLEAALPVSFVRNTVNARNTFPMIFAHGRRDSVRTVHRFFKSIELAFG